MRHNIAIALTAAALAAFTASACGGGSSSTPTTPTSPTTPTTPTSPTNPTTPTNTATITIGADGRVTPSSVTITRGGTVTMLNSHNQPHDMWSDPHPEHTQCPELNWGFLSSGQNRASSNLNTARSCGFHDHNQPDNASLKGTIIIQ